VGNREIFEKPIDLSHEPNQLRKFDLKPGQHLEAGNMSSDGRYLFLSANSDIGYYDVVNKTYEELDFINTPGWEVFPAISPDGKWLAYMSNNTGIMQVYVAPFPGPGLPSKISLDVGSNPVWAPDMKALYYVGGGYMWQVRVRTEPTFSAEKAEALFPDFFTRHYSGSTKFGRFDIHPDGDRFLGLDDLGNGPEYVIKVIVNWEQELKSK